MRLIILLACVWCACAGVVPQCVVFNGQNYEKTVLQTFPTNVMPHSFSFVKSKDTLFFSYALPPERTDSDDGEYTAVASLNIGTNEMRDIPGISSGGTHTAIDPDTEDIYLAGDDGLYKYNSGNGSAYLYTAKYVNVAFIYYDKLLFYVNYANNKLYKYDGNVTEVISRERDFNGTEVNAFISNGNEYFVVSGENSKLYRIVVANNTKGDEELYTAPKDEFIYLAFAKDSNNNIFVYGDSEVYVPNREQKKLDKVADIVNVKGLAFDKDDNVIYSNYNEIVKLTRSECTPA